MDTDKANCKPILGDNKPKQTQFTGAAWIRPTVMECSACPGLWRLGNWVWSRYTGFRVRLRPEHGCFFRTPARSEPGFRSGDSSGVRGVVREYSVVRDRPGERLQQAAPEAVTGTRRLFRGEDPLPAQVCTTKSGSGRRFGVSRVVSVENKSDHVGTKEESPAKQLR